jgi:hypothetical protein
MKLIIPVALFILCIIVLMFYMAGSHGKLMFRSHMTEDWIIWGIAAGSAITGIWLLVNGLRK